MRSGIVINFDYENNDMAVVQQLFEEVKDGMLSSGFRREDRLFTIELAADEACNLARLVIEYIDSRKDTYRDSIYMYLKEFYGFEMTNVSNMMVPDTDGIEVRESDHLALANVGLAV